MTTHINIGGPVVGFGRFRSTQCISHVYDVEYKINVEWRGDCMDGSKMTCGCIPNTVVCVPRGDYRRIVVDVTDANGDAMDVTMFTDSEYVIAVNVRSAPIITKALGSGITIGGDNSSFIIEIEEADSRLLPRDYIYHEFRLSQGVEGQTVFAGFFRSPETILGVI